MDNCMVSSRSQVIIKTDDALRYWDINTSLGLDGLLHEFKSILKITLFPLNTTNEINHVDLNRMRNCALNIST